MGLEIRKIRPELADDYLYFFDTAMAGEHSGRTACYCLESHIALPAGDALSEKDCRMRRREKARQLIMAGIMNGYLAYQDHEIVGWCNADDKRNYCGIRNRREYWPEGDNAGKTKSIYCFAVAPGWRGRGISGELLARVCEDSRAEGFRYAEAYPVRAASGAQICHGPLHLYEKQGFQVVWEKEGFLIVRKAL